MAGKRISYFVFVLLLCSVESDGQVDDEGPLLSKLTDGFDAERNNMNINGFAEIETNGLLRLTNGSLQVVGHAFYSHPIQFKNSSGEVMSFSTSFAFAIITQHGQRGGDGLAFTISPTKELTGGAPGPYLGLFNAGNNGNFSNHVFAVEMDTVKDSEFGDIDDNHVGIDINSVSSNASVHVIRFKGGPTNTEELNLKSGQVIQAWVIYNSQTSELVVKVSPDSAQPRSELFSGQVNLTEILQESMYVGFSASTGSSASSHYILGWSFEINGASKNLYLDKLPKLPTIPGTKKNRTHLIVGFSVSGALAVILVAALAFYFVRRIGKDDVVEAWEQDVGPHRFSYKELKKATRGFSELIGSGGFGRVYKGTLTNTDTRVAVKRISHDSRQGLREFVSEVASIGRLRHRNLVQLLGWCRREGDLLLVYDFMPNGSLDKHLFDEPNTVILSWERRFNIIKGLASGLLYLHEEWEQAVVHRDIKAGNVLLDSDFNGRLSDFGLAKLYEHGSNPSTTRVVGTLGYLAPELVRTGKPTTSSDLFAFGALLLEMACGRRPIDSKTSPDQEPILLVEWVRKKWNEGAILDVVDPRLEGDFDRVEAVLVLKLGLMCSNGAPEARPTTRQLVRYLEAKSELQEEVMVVVPYSQKDGAFTGCDQFENYEQYFPTTSTHSQKASTQTSIASSDGDAIAEASLTRQFSVFGGGDDGR